MAGAAERLMEADDFLVWCASQEARHELVDGEIVMMAGASRRHDLIVVNLLAGLRPALRGGPCTPHTADLALRTRRRTIRRPDVTVDCGDRRGDALEASKATAVFEVLSPSTRQIDLVRKLGEYRALPGLRHVVLIEQSLAQVTVYDRPDDDGAWTERNFDGVEGAIELPVLSISLLLAELYADVEFDTE